MAKILFIGDIFGKGGREVLRQVLPQWKEKYQPDVVIVNVENMAHGKGVTMNTMDAIKDLGIDCYTSGNHIFDKGTLSDECFENYDNLIRPANIGSSYKGHGYYRFAKEIAPSSALRAPFPKGEKEIMNRAMQQYLVINLHGTVFLEKEFDGTLTNPFLAIDKLLAEQGQKGDIIIIDLHAEASSEKVAFGYYVDGRVTGVFGTHTHVPTADARILPLGTAYITDVGMTGPRDGVIGVKKENVLAKFLDPNVKFKNDPEEEGVMQINGVLIEVESEKLKVKRIEKLYQEII
jgi:2',3'-cyclic-nucleotide 2'-phosphodiesterase